MAIYMIAGKIAVNLTLLETDAQYAAYSLVAEVGNIVVTYHRVAIARPTETGIHLCLNIVRPIIIKMQLELPLAGSGINSSRVRI